MNNKIENPEKLYTLTKWQIFEIYKWGEHNMDSDGCQIDDSVENFEEIMEDLEPPTNLHIEEPVAKVNTFNAGNYLK